MRRPAWLLCLLLALVAPALAGEEAVPSSPAPENVLARTTESTPVEVPVPSEKALRFYRSGNLLWTVSSLWGLLVPLAWLATGASAGLRTRVRRWTGNRWYPTVTLFLLLFVGLGFLIDLPLAYYAGYVRQHAFGLSNQTLGKWMGDQLKGFGLALAATALFAWVPFWLLAKSPRRWWLWTAALAVPLMVLLVVVAPIWIDPLFNDFGPMRDRALEADILALAERAGIDGSRVFEVDKSVDTEAVNAYVTGLGGTKRIVLWDTLLAKLERRQVLFVMAHEMGHYVLGHVWKTLLALPLLVLAALWLVHRSSGALLARFGDRFGFRELGDVAAAPLLALLVGLFFFLVSPLVLATSRSLEREADRFGLELTRDNRAAAEAFVRLQQENLSHPRPGALYRTWRASHPPLGERIDFCNGYRPWAEGEPLRYGERMR